MTVRTAVVLAAGEGTRLRPLTRNRPKPMLPAANRPILAHVLDALVDAGMDRIVIVVGYRRERVQEYFGPDYRDVPLEYVHQQKQLGTGHALLQAREAVSGPSLVVNGDHIVDASMVTKTAAQFTDGDARATIAIIERDDPSKYGAVRHAGGTITEISEKPETDTFSLINAGIYAFDGSIFDAIEATPRKRGELSLTDTLEGLVAERQVRGVPVDGLWVDATYPWDLLEVTERVLEHGLVQESRDSQGVWIAETARVHENATLQAPVVVSADCEIGPGTVVGPNVALCRNVTVGANATLDSAVVETDSRIGHGSTLVDAVVGQNVTLGVQTLVPGGLADVRIDTRIHEAQRLGAVLADRVRCGGGVSFDPGTLVGPGATIDTGVTVGGEIPTDAEVVR